MGCHGNNWTEGGPAPERVEEPVFLLEFKGLGSLKKTSTTVQFVFHDTLFAVRSVSGRIVGETQTVNKETSVVHAIKDNTIGPTC